MATIVAMTSIKLNDEQEQKLVKGVIRAFTTSCTMGEDKVSVMLLPQIPECNHGVSMDNRINYFLYAAGNPDAEKKARIYKRLYEETVAVTGDLDPYKVIMFYRPGSLDNFGMDSGYFGTC